MPASVVVCADGPETALAAKPPRRGREGGVSTATIRRMKKKQYNERLGDLEVELAKLQAWIKDQGLRIVVIFEGRDAAGKGGTIKTITRRLSPRVVRTVALPVPTERQKTEWFLQRYVPHLPAAGEMVLFDRSWYNRLNVERVMGFCTDEEYERFLRLCPSFEQTLVDDGVMLIKYWLHTSDDEQERRFQSRNTDPKKRWKLSPMDLTARSRWVDYSRARDVTFEHTNTAWAPWNLADLEDKRSGRLNVITHLLSQIPYQDLTPPPLELPERQPAGDYVEPDWRGLEIPRTYT
jgi:polyphosphate kinase 2